MRTSDQCLLNAVQRPEAYEEVVISLASSPIVLSVWCRQPTAPAVLFLPGTMTHPLRTALRLGGRLAPGLLVPFGAYLEMERVSRDASIAERFYTDPLGRRNYPLGLLVGMLDEDIAQPVSCPVLVVAASGDPLFSLNYTKQVFARINAPSKELLVVDCDEHLIFNTAVDLVLLALLPHLRAVKPATALIAT